MTNVTNLPIPAAPPGKLLQFPLKQSVPTQCVVDGALMYLYAAEYTFGSDRDIFYVWARSEHEARCKVFSIQGASCYVRPVHDFVAEQTAGYPVAVVDQDPGVA